jgi:predicted XRE-type DNA-binding protein
MSFTKDLRLQLARHVCAIIHDWPQNEAAVFVRLSQPDISRLRSGDGHRFTADRLLRAIAHSGHHVSISIRAMQKRLKETPTITVLRYDRYGRLIELPPWQVRTLRHAGEGAP